MWNPYPISAGQGSAHTQRTSCVCDWQGFYRTSTNTSNIRESAWCLGNYISQATFYIIYRVKPGSIISFHALLELADWKRRDCTHIWNGEDCQKRMCMGATNKRKDNKKHTAQCFFPARRISSHRNVEIRGGNMRANFWG